MKTKSIVFMIIRGILCIALALLLYYALEPLSIKRTNATVEGSSNWMARLGDDVSIADVYLPGTHDSGTQFCDLRYFSQCQASPISLQLKDGYRYLDIRLGEVTDKEGNRSLNLFNGFCKCKVGNLVWSDPLKLDSVLSMCYSFLESNPTETIVFAVKMEQGEDVASFQQLLHEYIEKDADRWYLSDTIPRMAECRGKLVLMRRYEDANKYGKKSGIQYFWADQGSKEDKTLHAVVEQQDNYKLIVQDRYKYTVKNKWKAFIAGLEFSTTEKADLKVSFLSSAGSLKFDHPYDQAKTLNKNFLAEDISGYAPVWIIQDFSNPLLAQHVYELNFK